MAEMKMKNFKKNLLVKDYRLNLKIIWYKIGYSMTLYQGYSNYSEWLKNMAVMIAQLS